MNSSRIGFVYGVAAYSLWGLLPLYWVLIDDAHEFEMLAHRIAWSLLVVALLLTVVGGFRQLTRLGGRALRLLALAAVVVSVNWGTYIWAVTNGHIIETSLGYFINPLMTVALGIVVFGERLRAAQWVAVGIAGLAVLVLTVDYGRLPYIALALACTFATYGLLKKRAGVGAVQSLAVETAILFLPAVGFLTALELDGTATFGHTGVDTDILLVAAGLVTAIPLLFFASAATRVPLTTLGLLQYLAPIVQFILGVLVFREDVPPVRLAGFALVWTALAVLTVEAFVHRRRQIRLALAGTSPVSPATSSGHQ